VISVSPGSPSKRSGSSSFATKTTAMPFSSSQSWRARRVLHVRVDLGELALEVGRQEQVRAEVAAGVLGGQPLAVAHPGDQHVVRLHLFSECVGDLAVLGAHVDGRCGLLEEHAREAAVRVAQEKRRGDEQDQDRELPRDVAPVAEPQAGGEDDEGDLRADRAAVGVGVVRSREDEDETRRGPADDERVAQPVALEELRSAPRETDDRERIGEHDRRERHVDRGPLRHREPAPPVDQRRRADGRRDAADQHRASAPVDASRRLAQVAEDEHADGHRRQRHTRVEVHRGGQCIEADRECAPARAPAAPQEIVEHEDRREAQHPLQARVRVVHRLVGVVAAVDVPHARRAVGLHDQAPHARQRPHDRNGGDQQHVRGQSAAEERDREDPAQIGLLDAESPHGDERQQRQQERPDPAEQVVQQDRNDPGERGQVGHAPEVDEQHVPRRRLARQAVLRHHPVREVAVHPHAVLHRV